MIKNSSSLKIKIISLFFLLFAPSIFANGNTDKIETFVKEGNISEIKELLKKQEELAYHVEKGSKDNMILLSLKEGDNKGVISLLLKYGADPVKKNAEGITPLMYACKNSSTEIMTKLLKSGTIFSFQRKKRALTKDKNGLNSYEYAIDNPNNLEALESITKFKYVKENPDEILLNSETSLTTIEESPVEAIDITPQTETQPIETITENVAIVAGTSSVAVIAGLSSNNNSESETENESENEYEDVNEYKSEDTTNLEVLDTSLIDNEKTLIAAEALTFTPIYLFDVSSDEESPYYSDFEPQQIEQEVFIDANTKDKNNVTPLMKASANNNLEQMQKLIKSGALINATDKDGWTAAMFLVRYNGSYKALKLLADNGADFSLVNNYGISALQIAARYSDDKQIISLLLKNRNNFETEVKNAFITAIVTDKSIDILKEFLHLSLPLNQLYTGGKTPLIYAAQKCSKTETIAFLLQNGAEKRVKSFEGKTAFDYATTNRNLKHDKTYWSLNTKGE